MITNRKAFSFSIILFLFGSFAFFQAKAQKKEKKPNVLYIMCDDLNDYQGVFGGHKQAKTPYIDKLAKSGVQFLNAQTNAPVCMPSRSSLFTGVYPHDSGDFGWTVRTKQPVLVHNKPLMKLLRENGYKTYGSGKLLHGNEDDLWDGWGAANKHDYGPFVVEGDKLGVHPDVPAPYRTIGPIDGSYGRLSTGKKWAYGWDKKPFRYNSEDDRDLMQDELHTKFAIETLKKLEQEDDGKPFFLGIGFVNPHTPLHAPDRFFDMFPMDKLELDDWFANDPEDTYLRDVISQNSKGFKYYRMLKESYGGDREKAMKAFLQAYLACIAFVDEQIGQVVEALEKSKFADNTIIIFTSDHGWQMGEKDYLFKNSPWEESARIPMIVRTPDSKAGKKVEQPVSLVDIYPTIMDYCGLKGDHKLNKKGAKLGGHSMVPLFDNSAKTQWKGPNGALTIVGNLGPKTTKKQQHYSYRTKDWRYIHYANGKEELYCHKKDSREWNNLANDEKYAQIKKQFRKEISEIVGVKF